MKFGDIPIEQASGCILAHSVRARGLNLKKGTMIDADIIGQLRAADLLTVMAACPGADDVLENAAAERIARAISGAGVTLAAPFTGRANVLAAEAGVFSCQGEQIKELNRIDEAMTIATLKPMSRVDAGQMVATVKIIPFAVAESKLVDLENVAAETRSEISVAPFAKLSAGLVMSRLTGDKESLIEKRRQAIETRLIGLGGALASVTQCTHNIEAVTRAIEAMNNAGHDIILVFGASAIVDRADVIPAALERAGGEIVHLGMPVDPGNLLLYGTLSGKGVIGVPTCASSIKENGFDWALERLFAKLPLSHEDFIDMAPGGLLKEIPSRPQPRAKPS